MTRVLVCGSRWFTYWPTLVETLDIINSRKTISLIIEGGAIGADRLGRRWAYVRNVPFQTFAADWAIHGKSAGPIRNQKMLDEGNPDMVVAFPAHPCGPGTAHMMQIARAAGVEVMEISR